MRKYEDLTGREFGSLTVVKRVFRPEYPSRTFWECTCQCGERLVVRADNLMNGHSARCTTCNYGRGYESVRVTEHEHL